MWELISREDTEAMVRGYHVDKGIWATVVGEELPCQREDGNRADPFAVAMVRGEARQSLATFRRRYHQFALSIYAWAA